MSDMKTGEQDDLGLSWQGLLISFLIFSLLSAAGVFLYFKYESTPFMKKVLQEELDSREWYGDRSGNSEFGAVSGTYVLISVAASWYIGYRLTKRYFKKSMAATEPLPVWATWLIVLGLFCFIGLLGFLLSRFQ